LRASLFSFLPTKTKFYAGNQIFLIFPNRVFKCFVLMSKCDSSISYEWYFDGYQLPVPGKCVNFGFTTTGWHSVVVKWSDCEGNHVDSFSTYVKDCSACDIIPRIAYTLNCPIVKFDATSTYSNQQPVIYIWKFGDGKFDTGPKVQHQYRPGNYDVTLTVYSVNSDGKLCECQDSTHADIAMPGCEFSECLDCIEIVNKQREKRMTIGTNNNTGQRQLIKKPIN
jgi:hypothetical protein